MIKKYEEDKEIADVYYQHRKQIESWTKGRLYKHKIYNEDMMQEALYFICRSIKPYYIEREGEKIFDVFLNTALNYFVYHGIQIRNKAEDYYKNISLDYNVHTIDYFSDSYELYQNNFDKLLTQIEIDTLCDMILKNLGETYYTILCMNLQEYNNAAIGRKVGLSPVTIAVYLDNIDEWFYRWKNKLPQRFGYNGVLNSRKVIHDKKKVKIKKVKTVNIIKVNKIKIKKIKEIKPKKVKIEKPKKVKIEKPKKVKIEKPKKVKIEKPKKVKEIKIRNYDYRRKFIYKNNKLSSLSFEIFENNAIAIRDNFTYRYYMVYCLRYNGYTFEEISKIFNVSYKAVGSMLYKVNKFLKNLK